MKKTRRKAIRIKKRRSTPRRIGMTPIEYKILRASANGKTYREIASALKMTYFAVDWHIRQITRCMKARNMTNAVYKGIKQGILK